MQPLLDALPHPVFTASADGTCTFANARLRAFTGPGGDLWPTLVHPGDRDRILGEWEQAVASREDRTAECRMRKARSNAPFKRFEMQMTAVRDAEGVPESWMVTFSFISERAQDRQERLAAARAEMSKAADLFPLFSESLRDVFWVADTTLGALTYVSPAYEKVWGRPVDSIMSSFDAWSSAIHPDDRERIVAARSLRDMASSWEEEYRIVRPDGATRWIRERCFPRLTDDGQIIRFAGVAEDITDHRELEMQLQQTQKMDSIGQLASGIAHDFNNLLTIIVACTEELLERTAPDDEMHEPLVETREAVRRATALTRDLLDFSRRQPSQPKIVELNAVVGSADRMLRRLLGEDVRLVTVFEPDLDGIRIDPGHLTSVLVNLSVNARHAMPRGGTLTVRTDDVRLAKGNPFSLPAGRYTTLEGEDTGSGFTAEIGARIFEPFFTTKDAGKGTGLGLAVVRSIVETSGGRIEVTSELGVGSRFRIFFPVAMGVAESNEIANAPIVDGSETVLLVEDEEGVRRSAVRGLEARGFKVLPAADAEAAIRILEERGDEIDILVTDVILPRMDGRSLATLSRRYGRMKVLFTSGYTDDDVSRYGISKSQVAFIEKPYTPRGLIRRMQQIIGTGAP